MELYLKKGPRDHAEVKGRAHRIGQKHRVTLECMPGEPTLADLEARPRSMAPALLAESLAGQASCRGAAVPRLNSAASIAKRDVYRLTSSRGPGKVHRVISGRGRHLDCICSGFR
jgi:hypothetical protein